MSNLETLKKLYCDRINLVTSLQKMQTILSRANLDYDSVVDQEMEQAITEAMLDRIEVQIATLVREEAAKRVRGEE